MHTSFYKIVLYNYKTYAHERRIYCEQVMALAYNLHELHAATTENLWSGYLPELLKGLTENKI